MNDAALRGPGPMAAGEPPLPDGGSEGLTDAQASERLHRDGPNVLPAADRKGLLGIAWRAFTQPMFLLLLCTAAVYALLGSMADAAILLLSLMAVGGLSIFQEQRTERTLEALKDLSSPRCSVVRQGRVLRVASQSLVRGDRLLVNEGDRLAADAQLVQSQAVEVDESQLTGESVPVAKCVGADASSAALYAGSLVVQGDGVAVVTAMGADTALGRIGGSLTQLRQRPSRLEQELKRLVWQVAILAMVTCILAAVLFALRDGSWTGGLLVGLTLAMSLIPEEFAVVWSVMLALGGWRLARAQVLTRQPQAIEALGTTTVLCVDKTGTLTRNQMVLAALCDGNAACELAPDGPVPDQLRALVAASVRACVTQGIEPMDRAIIRVADLCGLRIDPGSKPLGHQGVGQGRPYVVHWWQDPGAAQPLLVVKGAPEAVLALCDTEPARLAHLQDVAQRWSAAGMRVLAVAQGPASAPPGGFGLPAGSRLSALGLLAFMDPLRDGVREALADCRRAGVKVVMITGDSPLTALAIARSAGLVDPLQERVVTGAQLAAMNEFELKRAVSQVRVFARVEPALKLRIVQALQLLGEVVAMTGDGVNDAPALRAADIGVAMGQRGTDVAREAASLVLLNDSFASLVDAVRAGRRIFVNLRKALGYLFAVHVPIVGLALIPVAMGGTALLLPVHVVLLELVIDPACSLVFEAEPAPDDLMQVPPRAASQTLFSPGAALNALALGALAFGGVAAVQWIGWQAGAEMELLRLAGLGSIVAANLMLLVWFRGLRSDPRHTNGAFYALVLGVCIVSVLIVAIPTVAAALGMAVIAPAWALIPAMPAAWAVWRLATLARRQA